MNEEDFIKAIEEMKNQSPQRKFLESVDIAVNLKDINLQDPSKRFQLEVKLPKSINKDVKVCVFAEGSQLVDAKEAGAERVVDKNELENISRDKKLAKKLAQNFDYFVASAPLMPVIGRSLGKYLGPRGKMPKPVPPTAPIKPIIETLKQTIKIRLRQSPVMHARIGTADMDPKTIAENAITVIRAIERKLEKGENNIRSVFIKTTMGPAIKVK